WAVGSTTGAPPSNSFILRYTNGSWQIQRTFTGVTLESIAMTSTTDGWITGSRDDTSGAAPGTNPATLLLMRYVNRQWVDATSTIANANALGSLLDVTMRTPTDGWMTCQKADFKGVPTLLHYDGTRWTEWSLPALANTSAWDIRGVTTLSATVGWAVGEHEVKDSNYATLVNAVILHYHGGVWSVVNS
ncbi:MAG: hypothetical protein ACRDHE_13175, partial [Ktedonobacterales bacterium]